MTNESFGPTVLLADGVVVPLWMLPCLFLLGCIFGVVISKRAFITITAQRAAMTKEDLKDMQEAAVAAPFLNPTGPNATTTAPAAMTKEDKAMLKKSFENSKKALENSEKTLKGLGHLADGIDQLGENQLVMAGNQKKTLENQKHIVESIVDEMIKSENAVIGFIREVVTPTAEQRKLFEHLEACSKNRLVEAKNRRVEAERKIRQYNRDNGLDDHTR